MSRKHEIAALLTAALLCVATPVFAQKAEAPPATQEQIVAWRETGIAYFEGNQRFMRQNYRNAREYFEKSGGEGDAISLYYLGNIYNDGLGIEQDEIKARLFYQSAAQKGHADSQMLTAVFQIMDGIIERSELRRNMLYADAVQWLEKSEAQGNTEAQFWLGDMKTKGLGTDKDPVAGRALLDKAAKNGNPNALAMLSAYYWRAMEGESKDLMKAHLLMSEAQANGNEQAANLLLQIEAEMTEEQRENARKAAKKFAPKPKK